MPTRLTPSSEHSKHAAKFELISEHSIILTIEGSDKDLKPLML